MSDGQQQQQGEESLFSPALPPAGSTTEVTEGHILPEAGRTSIRTYLETVFHTFQLGAEYSLGDSLKHWLEIIDNHERRLIHAEREGRRREPQRAGNSQWTGNPVRLPGVEALLAGSPRNAAQGDDSPDQQHSQGDTNPPPTLGEPGGGNDAQQTRPDGLPGDGTRWEEENPRGETRTQSARRNHRYSSDEEDESNDRGQRERPTKRAKQDKSLFNWAADAFIKQSVLSPKHRKVIQEINKFAEALELSTFAKPAPTKAIVDQTTWRRAWRATADAISFAFTNCHAELIAYEEHIGCLFDDNLASFHRNIINYDKAMHQLIGSRRDILFDEFEHAEIKGTRVLATGPRRFAGSSIGEAVMGVNEGTFAPHAENQDTERKSAENQVKGDQELAESSTSLLPSSHFWNATVDFFPSPGDKYEDVAEKSEGKMHGIESGSEEGRKDKMEGKGIGEGSTPSLPQFMRGLGFREDVMVLHSRTASFTESDDPLPRPALVEYNGPAWETIQTSPHLFRVQMPINGGHLEAMLHAHPNRPFVDSILIGLKEGFWPWASTRPQDDFPATWDNAWAPLPSEREREFIKSQSETKTKLGRHSQPFGPDLLPGMYSTVIAVPKPHTEDLCLVAHQSAGEFCQNNMVDKSQTKGNRLDSLLIFLPLLLAFMKDNPGKRLVLWKSDVANVFRLLPMHPLWQIKQVVTTGMPTRKEAKEGVSYKDQWSRSVDWCACFGNSGSPRIWNSVMGLIVWIAIHTLQISLLCCFMDDCFSIALAGDLELYEPYSQKLPREQVKLLRLWDFLGIPHKQSKQVWGETLTIIGFLVDSNELMVTLPSSRKDELVVQVRKFTTSCHRTLQEWQQLTGWINWSLNAFPLLRPALSNVYNKMKGKSNQSAQIFVNKAVRTDLTWFAEHVETPSGMYLFASTDWSPLEEFDLVIYGDACLQGMGFWIPSRNLGFAGRTDPSSPMASLIFYWEALTVLFALRWLVSSSEYRGSAKRPTRLTFRSNSSNTSDMFNSLHAQP
ncbi:hypothetical protein F5876DRAFT_79306 [Lentinula aff. lateritia]|uniref:Uncharacterized protein n=1 Tax=Lentinula aff. lateritia TaxID=2804960 RepID=A0ACC1TSW2_9AGAR|nr:hypothetical protein F5876DRAFT_79306 [Lentinula aff. lateritia]